MRHLTSPSLIASAILLIVQTAGAQTSVTVAPSQVVTRQSSTTEAPITGTGTVSELSPDAMMISGESGPVSYRYTKSTTIFDENGAALNLEAIHSGAPVTVYYSSEGSDRVVSRVVVRKIAQRVDVVPAPSPIVVERVLVAPAPAPVVVNKTVVVEPAHVSPRKKKVIVEEPAPRLEKLEKTTKTTTTTTDQP